MNYCSYLAADTTTNFPNFEVYSNVDPAREWNGTPTIEFNEPDDPKTTSTISGAAIVTRSVYAIARTESCEDAETVLFELCERCTKALDALLKTGTIDAFAIDERGITADVRGIVEGESFYGYVKFLITERI